LLTLFIHNELCSVHGFEVLKEVYLSTLFETAKKQK